MAYSASIHAKRASFLAAGIVLASPPVSAAASALPIAYHAGPGCPHADTFLERIDARTRRARLATERDSPAYVVSASPAEDGFVARIQVADRPPDASVRTIRGKTCDEVVTAAALIVALDIEAKPDAEVPVDAPPFSPAAEMPPPRAPARPPLREMQGDAPASKDAGPRAADRAGWSLGAAGAIDGFRTPQKALSVAVFGERLNTAPLSAIRVELRGAASSAEIDDRRASFTLLTGAVSLCPFSFAVFGRLDATACGGLEMGRLGAAGEASAALPESRSAVIFWAAARAAVLLHLGLSEVVDLEAGADLGFPLIRHEFIFEVPTELIYRIPGVGAGGHLGFRVRFP
jgi:hypothetical protein